MTDVKHNLKNAIGMFVPSVGDVVAEARLRHHSKDRGHEKLHLWVHLDRWVDEDLDLLDVSGWV